MRNTALLCLLLVPAACGDPDPVAVTVPTPTPTAPSASTGDLVVEEPVSHENLSICLIRRPGAAAVAEYLTLEEGLKSGAVRVAETGQVNELTIQNDSDRPLYVQGGDVVRGGKQDRAIANDFVVPPRSEPISIGSFCVEQGRWSARAGEVTATFAASGTMHMTGKEMKLACQVAGDQGEVWSEVAKSNASSAANSGTSRDLPASGSLELLQSSEEVQKAVGAYVERLAGATAGKPDAVGFALCVNGAISTVEVYGDPGIFAKLWPKLLRSAAAEALAAKSAASAAKTATPADVLSFMAQERDAAARREKQTGPRSRVAVYDAADWAACESRDADGKMLRSQWINKR